ncbi:Iron-sulfur cluster-binding protein [Minicystis rosea]|nr:Iron-sulfur cluster-binding protein [Minicystis rosea]
MKLPARPRVIIRRCPSYDVERIRQIVREGLEELDLRPHGRTLIKPNVVASGPTFKDAFTRPEFVEGVIRALRDRDDGRVRELAVGERCGITIPTRMAYDGADYYPMFKRTGVKHYHLEEEPQVEIRYSHKGRLRDYVFTPEPIAKADFFVNCPKFKSHPWTTVTFAMKNYIGIQDDRHRLIDHDHRLNEKIADLQYIIQPQFIAIDAITAGEGRMLTPIPFDLGLVIMGNAQVAFDAVCSRIIGLDPATVDHIRMASERGFGSMDLADIDISGDVTLEEAQAKARGFKVGLIRVEKYFEGSSITAYAGPPPELEHTDYCWGGCPGAIEEAIEILRLYDQQCDTKMPRLHVVFGAYAGGIDAKPGEKIVFIGDCAKWEGKVGDRVIKIESLYKDRSRKDPYVAKHDDIFAKMASVTAKMALHRNDPYLRLEGCPVSVAEQVLALVSLSGVNNPYLAPDQVMKFNKNYLAWRGSTVAKRIGGTPYQIHGPCSRGEAAPDVTK